MKHDSITRLQTQAPVCLGVRIRRSVSCASSLPIGSPEPEIFRPGPRPMKALSGNRTAVRESRTAPNESSTISATA